MKNKGFVIILLILIFGVIISYFFDNQISVIANQSLSISNYYAKFWAYLNHPEERYLNVVIMIIINIYVIYNNKNYKKDIISFLYYALWLELTVICAYYGIEKTVMRPSPNLVLPNMIDLKSILPNVAFKPYSNSTMPSGHGLAIFYWGLFINQLSRSKTISYITMIAVILFTMNRLFAGLHWLSDILAGYIIAYVSINIANNYYKKIFTNFKKYNI